MNGSLTEEMITFGKYKGKTLDVVLRDRGYCNWLVSSCPDFAIKYEYLYNRINNYDPLPQFLNPPQLTGEFVQDYRFFHLRMVDDVTLPLTHLDRTIYNWYRSQVFSLRDQIISRISNKDPSPYGIKAPTRLKKDFSTKTGLDGKQLDEMLNAYELPNIISIVMRDIKKEAGVEYKGGNAFVIAKQRSEDQEAFWETVLKEAYDEDIGAQFSLESCIFDFIHIKSKSIFECKLGFTEFNKAQFDKYQQTLQGYSMIYLVGNNDRDIRKKHEHDYIIDVNSRKIYVLEEVMADLQTYVLNVHMLTKPSYLDHMLRDFEVIPLKSIDGLSISKALDR